VIKSHDHAFFLLIALPPCFWILQFSFSPLALSVNIIPRSTSSAGAAATQRLSGGHRAPGQPISTDRTPWAELKAEQNLTKDGQKV
jgi:hypothetical protein